MDRHAARAPAMTRAFHFNRPSPLSCYCLCFYTTTLLFPLAGIPCTGMAQKT
jgi:hypothetical protein